MNKFDSVGVTQRMLAQMTGLAVSTINRYITSNSIPHLDKTSMRNMKYAIGDVRKIVKECYSKDLEVKKKIHAFYNFKGGIGKTSICFQVSSHFALMGFKVLVIDADPQAHLSTALGFSTDTTHNTLYDALTKRLGINDVILSVFPGYDCIPSNLSLTRVETELANMPKREEQLSMIINGIKKEYDFIFFDTNPTISNLNRNVITCADVLDIVTETQPFSLNGLRVVFEDLNRFYQSMQIEGPEIVVIPNKYEDRTTSSAEAMTVLREYYSEYMKPDFAIRKSEDINTAAKIGQPLALFCKKNSIAFEDIIDLVHYLLELSTAQTN